MAMLKRYTHLKAQRLVRKLEGHRNKGKQVVIDHLVPYPAAVEEHHDRIRIRLLDFEGLASHGQCHDSAIRGAQDALLRRLLTMIRQAETIPAPDQYLEFIDERRVIMIDPLGGEAA